jgi:hypothetical protein
MDLIFLTAAGRLHCEADLDGLNGGGAVAHLDRPVIAVVAVTDFIPVIPVIGEGQVVQAARPDLVISPEDEGLSAVGIVEHRNIQIRT